MFPTRNFEWLVIDALPIFFAYSVTSSNLKIDFKVSKAFEKLAKKLRMQE